MESRFRERAIKAKGRRGRGEESVRARSQRKISTSYFNARSVLRNACVRRRIRERRSHHRLSYSYSSCVAYDTIRKDVCAQTGYFGHETNTPTLKAKCHSRIMRKALLRRCWRGGLCPPKARSIRFHSHLSPIGASESAFAAGERKKKKNARKTKGYSSERGDAEGIPEKPRENSRLLFETLIERKKKRGTGRRGGVLDYSDIGEIFGRGLKSNRS